MVARNAITGPAVLCKSHHPCAMGLCGGPHSTGSAAAVPDGETTTTALDDHKIVFLFSPLRERDLTLDRYNAKRI